MRYLTKVLKNRNFASTSIFIIERLTELILISVFIISLTAVYYIR